MKQKIRRKLAALAAFIAILTYHMEHEPDLDYELLDNSRAFASYSGGLVYFGNTKTPPVSLDEGDVYIIDDRFDVDPDMKICDSYKIRSSKERREILEIMCLYEECYPTDWDRSIESMQLEWTLHNLSYDFNYQRESSTDVDLDNEDEVKYTNKILQKLLK